MNIQDRLNLSLDDIIKTDKGKPRRGAGAVASNRPRSAAGPQQGFKDQPPRGGGRRGGFRGRGSAYAGKGGNALPHDAATRSGATRNGANINSNPKNNLKRNNINKNSMQQKFPRAAGLKAGRNSRVIGGFGVNRKGLIGKNSSGAGNSKVPGLKGGGLKKNLALSRQNGPSSFGRRPNIGRTRANIYNNRNTSLLRRQNMALRNANTSVRQNMALRRQQLQQQSSRLNINSKGAAPIRRNSNAASKAPLRGGKNVINNNRPLMKKRFPPQQQQQQQRRPNMGMGQQRQSYGNRGGGGGFNSSSQYYDGGSQYFGPNSSYSYQPRSSQARSSQAGINYSPPSSSMIGSDPLLKQIQIVAELNEVPPPLAQQRADVDRRIGRFTGNNNSNERFNGGQRRRPLTLSDRFS